MSFPNSDPVVEHRQLRQRIIGLQAERQLMIIGERLQRHNFNPHQSREPNGRWVDEGGRRKPPVGTQVAQLGLIPVAIPAAITAAAGFYTALTALKPALSQVILSLKSALYPIGTAGQIAVTGVQQLNQEEAQKNCPRLVEVQSRLDQAIDVIKSQGENLSPQQYGTAVHTELKRQIDALRDPFFTAEESYLKGNENPDKYGRLGTVRVDVVERVNPSTVCIYDIKTGVTGLTTARMTEIVTTVKSAHPLVQNFIITEVRPSK